MNRSYYYSSSEHPQQSQAAHWQYQPSFYNGYSTNIPIIVNQSTPIVQSYYPPIEKPQQFEPIGHSHSSSMKYSNILRNPFSRSNHHQVVDQSADDFLYHEEQLNRNLTKHNIVRLPVKGDGNCLFYAFTEGLIYEMKVDPTEFGYELRQYFRLPNNFRSVDFADRLRQLCVDQWRLHEDYYSQFVDKEKVSFLKEVKKFSKNGVSDSILGDIVPLTIANALDINIIIFTSVSDLPRIDVKPERRTNSSSIKRKTIYLAYNQSGLGHYDAAYPRS